MTVTAVAGALLPVASHSSPTAVGTTGAVPTTTATVAAAVAADRGAHAPATRRPLKVRPAGPIVGERIVLAGRLRGAGKRRVVLQERRAGRWKRVAIARSSRTGAFRLRTRVGQRATRYRVAAPRTRIAGQWRPRQVTRVRAVKPRSRRIGIAAPTSVRAGSAIRVDATLRPVRRGRPTVLQRRDSGGWTRVARTSQDRLGRAAFSVRAGAVGAARFRVVAPRGAGTPRTVGTPFSVRIDAAPEPGPDPVGRILAPTHLGVVSGGVAVRVGYPTGAQVSAVDLFVDGDLAASAVPAGGGVWTATWDSADVEDGPVALVARARGGVRPLTDAITVDVLNHPEPGEDRGLPHGFHQEVMAAGLDWPTAFVPLADGTVLVAEKEGQVRLVTADGRVRPEPVVDLSEETYSGGDLGLVAMAIAPDFETSGHLYLGHSYLAPGEDPPDFPFPGSQRLLRVQVEDGRVVPGSREVVLGRVTGMACWAVIDTPDCLPTMGQGHGIDDLHFDDTDALLVTVGDGVAFWGHGEPELPRAQDLDVLAGKVLRIDPETGEGLPDNPFFVAGDPGANRSRVHALGFRNPFRAALDPATGQLVVGDVGSGHHEELNVVEPGANHGWPCYEGDEPITTHQGWALCQAMADDLAEGVLELAWPVVGYPHPAGGGGSITAGLTYRGTEYPSEYQGAHFFADYAHQFIRTTRLDAPEPEMLPFASGRTAGTPVQFRTGPDGRIWYLSIVPGEVRRLRFDDSCLAHEYAAEFFDTAIPGGDPVVEGCTVAAGIEALDQLPDGIDPAVWSARWTRRPVLPGGTYEFSASGGATVLVDGDPVTGPVRLDTGLHDLVVEHSGPALGGTVAWQRQGSPPTVTLVSPGNGTRVPRQTEVSVRARGIDAAGDPLPVQDVRIEVEVIHYSDDSHHLHPAGSHPGTSATFTVGDDHAPGAQAYRVTAFGTDASGWEAASAPIYLCLEENLVGVCG